MIDNLNKYSFQFRGQTTDVGENGWLFAEMGDCVLRVSIDIVRWGEETIL